MNVYLKLKQRMKVSTERFNQSYIALLDFDNIRKARVVCVLVIVFHLFFCIFISLQSKFSLFNVDMVPVMVSFLLGCITLSIMLYIVSFYVPVTPKTEFYFPIICLGYYGGSLMMVGYFLGMMTSLTGVFTIGSILSGLLLFHRTIMFYGSIPCLLVLVVTSLLNVFDILPYAPLFKPYILITQESQNFTILLNMFSSTFIGIAIVIMFNSFLDRWTDREENQRFLMESDPLTEILNRRGLSQAYGFMRQHNIVPQSTFCLALLDIDFFKKINDTYGHDGGDEVLKVIAKILRLNIRQQDILGRYGGEEFMLIFPNTTAEITHEILERCRRAIVQHELLYNGEIIQFSSSFGYTSVDGHYAGDEVELIKKADQGLYEAKHQGRNRIVYNA